MLAAEEKANKSAPKPNKSAQKKSNKSASAGSLDLAQPDAPPSSTPGSAPALTASGIDDALDALALTNNTPGSASAGTGSGQIDRHPERRYRAAYAAFEARRMPEVMKENKGLKLSQRQDLVRKEFEKSEENPFNKVSVRFDSSREEVRGVVEGERRRVEERLTRE